MKENKPFEIRRKFCPFSQKNSPKIDYKDIKISLYHNIYGAMSYYHNTVLDVVGLMDYV